MELRTAASPKDVKYYTTERLREEFLIDDLFKKGEIIRKIPESEIISQLVEEIQRM